MMKTSLLSALTISLLAVAVLLVAFALVSAASARTLTYREATSGGHWCNWSIAATCTRWRKAGGKSYGLGCTGPNDMRSGCRARGLR